MLIKDWMRSNKLLMRLAIAAVTKSWRVKKRKLLATLQRLKEFTLRTEGAGE